MAVLKPDKGRLLIDFAWKGTRCREYLRLDDTKEGRSRAKQIKIQIEGEISAGTLDYAKRFPQSKKARTIFAPPPPPPAPAAPPTFGVFAREWLELKRAFTSNAHHLDRTSLLETHLLPFFGPDQPVADVTFPIKAVERFVGHLKTLPGIKGNLLSAVRVNKARALLRRILDRAVKEKWLSANTVDEVERLRENPADIEPLGWEEVRLLLDKGFKNDPEMRRFYTVALFTGLRTSEQIGLKWGDLDWTSEPPTATIKRSFTKLDGEHLTKTKGSARAIDLRPQAARAIKEQQASSRLKSDFVFCNTIGGPLDRDNLMNRTWYPALKRAGIRDRKPYQTRHTFATLSLSAGEEIGWVARQLGHANTGMVIKHYYKHIKNNTRLDGSAFDKAAAAVGL